MHKLGNHKLVKRISKISAKKTILTDITFLNLKNSPDILLQKINELAQ
jgi:hypothetical protein